ncbi:hypothetical protein GQ600_2498 [Phytophthora cactorum]|nr:hypothetical protein GQ600_2498 [Phytophthora cactorum]
MLNCFHSAYCIRLFLGFVDLAITNAFIVFNIGRKAIGKPKISHIGFLKQLHLELCQLAERDWDTVRRTQGLRGLRPSVEPPRELWSMLLFLLRRCGKETQRAEKISGGDTAYYCSACVLEDSRKGKSPCVFLCNKVKHIYDGKARTCFEIWHNYWNNGTLRPLGDGKRSIRPRLRMPSGAPTALGHTAAPASLVTCSDVVAAAADYSNCGLIQV